MENFIRSSLCLCIEFNVLNEHCYLKSVCTESPQINISSVQSSYNEGFLVNISCTASGTPEPDVQWIRNKIVLKSSGRKTAFLTFSNINRADEGQYTCKANNSAGNDEKHVALVVHCK